jgi:predicted dehydrogenase
MTINIGTIGTGGFSHFANEAFLETGLAKVSGAYDIDKDKAGEFRDRFGCKVYESMKDLINSPDIDLVYISTPPFLHYDQTKRSLLAGKHVICEKPAALKSAEAKELVETAKQKKLLYAVNLMQRYNPLFKQVKEVIDKQILGEFLHGYLENYAADEGLEPDHWMWKQTWSGGIFIEHAVHFFDLFSGWLGDGKVISSQKLQRPGQDKPYWSRVQAIVKYPGGLVNFYHGFDQAVQMDRQEFRLLFERGEITLFEWVPTRIIIHGLVKDQHIEDLQSIFEDADIDLCDSFNKDNNNFKGRFKSFQADKEIILSSGDEVYKQERYKAMVSEMFRDQVNWINDQGHERIISGENGYTSLVVAEQAEKKAVKL